MKGLNFATAEEVNEMAKENVRLKQSNTKLKKQLKALEAENAKLKEILDSFDWEIRGNHVLTPTCTRLTDEQIKLLN